MRALRPVVVAALAVACSACSRTPEEPHAAAPVASGAASVAAAPPPGAAITAVAARAEIGKPAPDFTLKDLDGNSVHLADLKGKVVVLEWFNPGCPFVNMSHTKGSLKGLADARTKEGIVWLAVNSAAEGKQGYGVEANTEGKKKFGLAHPILLDPSGAVGHSYGAERTPHMFIVDDKGVLVYRGAADNSPDGEGESPTDGKLVNYVVQALDDLKAGKPVSNPSSKVYGCTVKYGS